MWLLVFLCLPFIKLWQIIFPSKPVPTPRIDRGPGASYRAMSCDRVDDMPKAPECERITLDSNYSRFYFFVFNPPTSTPTDGFAAKTCSQKSNYVTQTVARRLKLPSAKGSTHELSWRSSEVELNPTIRRSKFVVVSDDAMDIEVALGTEFLIGEVVEAQNEPSTNSPPLKNQASGRVGDNINLSTQNQGVNGVGFQPTSKRLKERGMSEPGTSKSRCKMTLYHLDTMTIVQQFFSERNHQSMTPNGADIMTQKDPFFPASLAPGRVMAQ
ncbi:hypothetical protein F4820DRAFT_428635 [Hypoxylon rubiginosum]|uniref:Uncharacterized protein n=1 Tax=Hypoxylon rubiginosum TaxID=110542 RepID=A0ACB9YUV8_9PEZI|nr:hypothetical protein F4820DRAFT_428635 [Hypoxylon rubiginosum]